MILLLTDKELAYRMGKTGRQIAKKQFDEELVFDKVKSVYLELLKNKGLK